MTIKELRRQRAEKLRAQDRRALERCMLRALRDETFGGAPGHLCFELQAVLYGLEKARRAVK